jgi:hypothetical protein
MKIGIIWEMEMIPTIKIMYIKVVYTSEYLLITVTVDLFEEVGRSSRSAYSEYICIMDKTSKKR